MELLPVEADDVTDDDNCIDANGLTAGDDREEEEAGYASSSKLSHGCSDDASLCSDKASASASSNDEGADEVFNEVKDREMDSAFDDDADDSIDEKCSDQFE